MLRLEAVTVCVGYGDFLEETAKHNRGLFDDWQVVTLETDERTREVCRKYSIKTLLSGDYQRQGEAFNKGRLIERGLQHLRSDSWRLHLDADIVLPRDLHQILDATDMDTAKIYGCDRIMVTSAEAWAKLQRSQWITHHHHCAVSPPPGFAVGTRWGHHEVGYVPIGFFQLWHSASDLWRGVRCRPYPTNHNDACRSDVQFALQWDRRHRELLAELFVVHLESEAAALGANWCGRRTKPFEPYPC